MTSKDIEKASVDYQISTRPVAMGGDAFGDMVYRMNINPSFISGAEWVLNNLWKPADGDDLPEIDREVIVLVGIKNPVTTDSSWGCEVAFAHRPNPDGWDGKNITTGEVEHYDVQTYDKGGWNIPDIKFWLDLELPKIEECAKQYSGEYKKGYDQGQIDLLERLMHTKWTYIFDVIGEQYNRLTHDRLSERTIDRHADVRTT